MKNLNVDLNIDLPALNAEQLGVDLKKLTFDLGPHNSFHAAVKTRGLEEMTVNANLKGAVNLQTLDDALGLKDLEIRGQLNADVQANGIFSMDKKLFPKSNGAITLTDGWLKTSAYPNPIQHINLTANIINTDGTFTSLGVKITPFQFIFEGNPIFINADLQNFDDMLYKVRAKGILNVGTNLPGFFKKRYRYHWNCCC